MGMNLRLLCLSLGLLAVRPAWAETQYLVRSDRWTAADERGYGDFIAAIGDSGCGSLNACLKGPANPFRASDPAGADFRADCADLPYALRFYYAWKRGLPFSYVSTVSPRGRASDIRYSPRGNVIEARTDIPSGADAPGVLARLRDAISSATYRLDPELETPFEQDFYSPSLDRTGIRPGTVIYDPNGHLAVVFRIEADGRIRYIDAHPDNSLTRGFYDLRFVRAAPGMGAGFKNWRPAVLEGARAVGGVLFGGKVRLAPNRALSDFALTQYYGTGPRPEAWRDGEFRLKARRLDYYDYVRASLSGGALSFDPVREIADMVASNCADLAWRAEAVEAGLAAGLQRQPHPARLPENIYGTDGDWEIYSTPSRDARLKTAFKNLRDTAERFVLLWRARDPALAYRGANLPADLLAAYDAGAGACRLSYTRSDGRIVRLGYEEARQRLFLLSFDPYACVEARWGAVGAEARSCRDGESKRAWYAAEQRLRNQIDRTYEARMDFTLRELEAGQGGVAAPPDTDARAYLLAALAQRG
jgi:hypothetical protein